MKQLHCPLNGLRNITEFTYGGEYHPQPNDQTTSSGMWAEYVFFHANKAGVVLEWWCHTSSSFWFIAERHTFTDKVLRTLTLANLRIELAAND